MDEEKQKEKIVKVALIKVGIKCDNIGFTYLTESILQVIKEPYLVYNVKNLFGVVAKKLGIDNYLKIESNIQNAINVTYNLKGFNSINELYGIDVIRPDRRPTVAEFINLIAQYYLLRMFEEDDIV